MTWRHVQVMIWWLMRSTRWKTWNIQSNWFQQSGMGSKRASILCNMSLVYIHWSTRLITMDTERWPCDTMWCYLRVCLFIDLPATLIPSHRKISLHPSRLCSHNFLSRVSSPPTRGPHTAATYRPPAAAYIATRSSTTSVIVGLSLGSWCHILSIKATGSTPQCFFSPAVGGRRCFVPTAS